MKNISLFLISVACISFSIMADPGADYIACIRAHFDHSNASCQAACAVASEQEKNANSLLVKARWAAFLRSKACKK